MTSMNYLIKLFFIYRANLFELAWRVLGWCHSATSCYTRM